jgi:hypothetical protein
MLGEPPLQSQEEMDAMERLADEREAFFNTHHSEFKRLYPDETIAVLNGEVIEHDVDLGPLVARLEARGIDPRDVWLEFVQVNTIFVL